MKNLNNYLQSSINSIPAAIADNLCLQLLALQQFIFARPEADRHPSLQEINMQTKLLMNIIRIKKFNVADLVAKNMATFIRSLAKEDKQLGKQVSEKYARFISGDQVPETEQNDIPQETPVNNAPLQTTAAEEDATNTHLTFEEYISKHGECVPPVKTEEQKHYLLDEPPFSEGDFQRYKHLLADYDGGDADTMIDIGDNPFNKRWIEYNLFQYTLPVETRRFVKTPDRYKKLIDHRDTLRGIRHYLELLAEENHVQEDTPNRQAKDSN